MNAIFPTMVPPSEASRTTFTIARRIEEFRQLQSPTPALSTSSSTTVAAVHRWSASELWIGHRPYSPQPNAATWVEAALSAVSSCRAADSLSLITYPTETPAASSSSLSHIACDVLCGRYNDALSLVNALVDVVISRCLTSTTSTSPTAASINHKDYALKLLRHVRTEVFPAMCAALETSNAPEHQSDDDFRLCDVDVFPRAWGDASTAATCAFSTSIMSRSQHAVRCVATSALAGLMSYVEHRLRTLQGHALAAVRVRQHRDDMAAKAHHQMKSKNAKKSSAILKVRVAPVVGSRDIAALAISALSTPEIVSLTTLLHQLRGIHMNHVTQGHYANLSVVHREVEWLLVTSMDHASPSIKMLLRDVSNEWKNVSLPNAVAHFLKSPVVEQQSSAASTQQRDGSNDHVASTAVALQILEHLERKVDTAQKFADPFWRSTSSQRPGSDGDVNPAAAVGRHDCTMLMRRVLESATSHAVPSSTDVVMGGEAFCTHVTCANLSTPLGCYNYLCSALENIVDDSVALFGPDHERSKLAEGMRRELTTRAMACGLLQR
jgi:hypothetical protein